MSIKKLEELTKRITEIRITSVLMIDNDEDLCKLIGYHLKSLGYSYNCAYSMASGNKKLEEKNYDVVLLDIVLPNGSGLDLLPGMKKRSPKTKFFILTGYPTLERQVFAMKHGAIAFMEKPFRLDELTRKIEYVTR